MALAIPTGTANAYFNKRTGYDASLPLKLYTHTTIFIPIQHGKVAFGLLIIIILSAIYTIYLALWLLSWCPFLVFILFSYGLRPASTRLISHRCATVFRAANIVKLARISKFL